nr:MAG TPA: hypothetical protein [Caudoviricetes sp.]
MTPTPNTTKGILTLTLSEESMIYSSVYVSTFSIVGS